MTNQKILAPRPNLMHTLDKYGITYFHANCSSKHHRQAINVLMCTKELIRTKFNQSLLLPVFGKLYPKYIFLNISHLILIYRIFLALSTYPNNVLGIKNIIPLQYRLPT